jgi:hypothetical protein
MEFGQLETFLREKLAKHGFTILVILAIFVIIILFYTVFRTRKLEKKINNINHVHDGDGVKSNQEKSLEIVKSPTSSENPKNTEGVPTEKVMATQIATAHERSPLASLIRQEGQKWGDALREAGQMLKENPNALQDILKRKAEEETV